ncbi:uncharacterized protein LOC143630311 [Bidens hawaiensis]|uniref:uncharacterized protein LOC143630311 n=1 Tax=Bidens hawaiensis TaxID=980011 RepID=UPI00404ADF9A
MGNIARRLNEKPRGQFSGTTQPNPAAQLKAINTRSGMVLGPKVVKERVEVEDEEVVDEEIEMEVLVEIRPPHIINLAHVPYPACLKHQKYTREYGHFLYMFRQLKINLPFIEDLKHMPKYAKFLKDLLKRKDRLWEVSSIPLNGDCLELELGELTPTFMSLSLVYRSVKYPRGIIENLLVKVDKFVFSVDFVVLDIEADERVPIILGRPFLRLIDVYDGRITLRVGNENVTYDVAKSIKQPGDHDDFSDPCHSVYFLNSFIPSFDTCLDYIYGVNLVEMDVDKELAKEVVDDVSFLAEIMEGSEVICEKNVEKPDPLELKVLPSHLEYAYLEEDGAVLGQRHEKHFHPIYYESKTLNDAQDNYSTTERELLAVVFASDKFRSYLVLWKTTVFTDQAALYKNGAENVAPDNFSCLEDPNREEIREEDISDRFPHESIDFVMVEKQGMPWFTNFANYLSTGVALKGMTTQQKKKFYRDFARYVWDDPFIFKIGGDRILR